MSKNGIALLVVALILGVVYAVYFTDWFARESIQIIPTIRPGRASAIPRDPGQPSVWPVSFAFDGRYKLTLIKVVVAEDAKTNKYPKALWHLISEKGSPPQKSVIYGYPIKDMKPAVPRGRPEPLQPNVQYLIMLEAGKIRGLTNFFTKEAVIP